MANSSSSNSSSSSGSRSSSSRSSSSSSSSKSYGKQGRLIKWRSRPEGLCMQLVSGGACDYYVVKGQARGGEHVSSMQR